MVFWILVLQCYWNNGPKKKNKMRQFWVKNTEGKQNRWKRDTFSSELAIRTGIVLIKMLKKRIEKRSNAFNWDKLPD